jgi:hypothetical protein
MLKHISLSDVVVSRVFVSSHFGFRFAIGSRSVVVHVVGLDPRCGPARSGPRAPPPDPFLSFDYTSLSLSPWCPRSWNGDRQSLDSRGELPLPLPFLFPARPPCPRPCASPLGRAPPRHPSAAPPMLPLGPPSAAPREPLPAPSGAPAPRARGPPACPRPAPAARPHARAPLPCRAPPREPLLPGRAPAASHHARLHGSRALGTRSVLLCV